MTRRSQGVEEVDHDRGWRRIGVGLGLGVGVIVLILVVGVVVPFATTGDDEAWTAQERAVAAHARTRVEDMLSGTIFQPTVTVAMEVEVLAAPETVASAPPGVAGVCAPEMPERAAVARVEAQTLFGITLWVHEITCHRGTLLGGV